MLFANSVDPKRSIKQLPVYQRLNLHNLILQVMYGKSDLDCCEYFKFVCEFYESPVLFTKLN